MQRDRAVDRPGTLRRAALPTGIALTAAAFAAGAWQRRWISDDGLIVLRTVRNLLAGNGPVFNLDERVEANTSAAWTYLVWFFGWLTQARLEYVALGLALGLSVAAVVAAMLGAARLWGGAQAALLVPAGAVVYVALPPAADYATSGLESGLVLFWLALLWWALLRWAQAATVRAGGVAALSFWAGLAPLVRPELTVIGAAALLVLVCAPVAHPRPWVFRLLLIAAAGSVPLAYQVWRMGYYGLPYPNTAVAKDAGGAKWAQGWTYLWDLTGPYWLWLPLLLLAGAAGGLLRQRRTAAPAANRPARTGAGRLRSPAVVVAVMVGGGLVLTVYELRVGGDFMHGRMLLPQLFCLLLPVMVLPIAPGTRLFPGLLVLAALLGVTGWALAAARITAVTDGFVIRANGIVDERIYYVLGTGHDHPIRAEDYLDYPRMRPMLRNIAETPNGGLLINLPDQTYWYVVPPPQPIPDGGAGHTVYFLNLGMTSMNLPLSVRVTDPMGLAYPLAAHTDRLTGGRVGHDKSLDAAWAVVDAGVVDQHPWLPAHIDPVWVRRARTAMSCPTTQDLLASTRAPLTATRFRSNVLQSLTFAATEIDRVPAYEIARCDLPPESIR
ncbi:flagellar motor control protein ZomB [Nocardia sp. NPDC050712]|uniref:flagellar motor control protein ZomB n=1 Tax=Nocardia sp. NPDC050712 TaxID=3155518 RepID=UPI0033DE84CF